VRLILTTEQQELAAAVRSFLAAAAPIARVRQVAEGEESYDRKTWERLAGELGVTGLAVPEEYGGAGAGRAEVAVVLEELGAALTPVPYFARPSSPPRPCSPWTTRAPSASTCRASPPAPRSPRSPSAKA